jgi:hypothetical protein
MENGWIRKTKTKTNKRNNPIWLPQDVSLLISFEIYLHQRIASLQLMCFFCNISWNSKECKLFHFCLFQNILFTFSSLPSFISQWINLPTLRAWRRLFLFDGIHSISQEKNTSIKIRWLEEIKMLQRNSFLLILVRFFLECSNQIVWQTNIKPIWLSKYLECNINLIKKNYKKV